VQGQWNRQLCPPNPFGVRVWHGVRVTSVLATAIIVAVSVSLGFGFSAVLVREGAALDTHSSAAPELQTADALTRAPVASGRTECGNGK
jgi:hypothetical protein